MKVQNINQAFIYKSEIEANNDLKKASGKLKGFMLLNNYIPNNDSQNKKCQRIQLSKTTRKIVYEKSKGHCCLCGNFVDYEDYTIDHIMPLAKGGTNDISNLQCTCKVCNNIKTDVLPDEFMDKITEMIIYCMNMKYNKIIGRKIFKMLLTANVHRILNNN